MPLTTLQSQGAKIVYAASGDCVIQDIDANFALCLLEDGTNPLTAAWDAGGYNIRALSLTPDGLSAGQVVYTGTDGILSAEAAFAYNAGTNTLTVANIAAALTGNVTGDCSGSSGTCTGLAGSATILATARAINGVDFNGSAAITVTADANTLSGNTLKSTILASSLTSVGTLANLTVTNTIVGSINGQAATVATIAGLAPDTATTQATQAAITSAANLATVGTIATGVWEGTDVGVPHGGTAKSSWTQYAIPYLSTTTAFGEIAIGAAGEYLKVSAGATGYEFGTPAGAGDVVGPGSSTDNHIAVFHLATGKVIQDNSAIVVDDSSNVSGMGTLGCGAITSTADVKANTNNFVLEGSTSRNVLRSLSFHITPGDVPGTDIDVTAQNVANGTWNPAADAGDADELEAGATEGAWSLSANGQQLTYSATETIISVISISNWYQDLNSSTAPTWYVTPIIIGGNIVMNFYEEANGSTVVDLRTILDAGDVWWLQFSFITST